MTTEEVQDLQLAINGTAVTQPFFMTDIVDYDIILGERWCLEHQAVIDYADESLYAKTAQGFLLRLDLTEEPAERKSSKPSLRKRWNDDVVAFSGVLQGTTKNTWGGHQCLSGSQASGVSPASPALFSQLPMSVVICHLTVTVQSAQAKRSYTTHDNNQTLYKV